MFVHFADLLTNLPNEIHRLGKFLDIAVSDSDVQRIAQKVTLEEMRAEAKQDDAGWAESFQGGATTFFFQGINGRWKGILSEQELALYHDAMARVLTREAGRWLEGELVKQQ